MRVIPLLLASFTALVYASTPKKPVTTLQIGIKHRVPEEECTKRSHDGDTLSMHYTGTLYDTGDKFDSSLDRNEPLQFTLGSGMVIKGWDAGLKNMCVGEKRRLKIPSHLAYGSQGAGASIPPNAALVFDVELMDVIPGHRTLNNIQINQTSDQDRFEQFKSPAFVISTAIIVSLFVVMYLRSRQSANDTKKSVKETASTSAKDGNTKNNSSPKSKNKNKNKNKARVD